MFKSALSQGKGNFSGQIEHGKSASWDFYRLFKAFNTQKKWQFTAICDLIKHNFVILIKQQQIPGRKMQIMQLSALTYTPQNHSTFLYFWSSFP